MLRISNTPTLTLQLSPPPKPAEFTPNKAPQRSGRPSSNLPLDTTGYCDIPVCMKHKPQADRHKLPLTYIRLEPELREKIQRMAKADDRPMSSMLRLLVAAGLEHRDKCYREEP